MSYDFNSNNIDNDNDNEDEDGNNNESWKEEDCLTNSWCSYCFHKECTPKCVRFKDAFRWIILSDDQKYLDEVISWDIQNNFWKIKKLLIKDNGGDTCSKCNVKGFDKVKKNWCQVNSSECNLKPYCVFHREKATKRCSGYCNGTFCSAHCDEDDHNCQGSPRG